MTYRFTVWVATLLSVGAFAAAYVLGHAHVFGDPTANDMFQVAGAGIAGGAFLGTAFVLVLRVGATPRVQ